MEYHVRSTYLQTGVTKVFSSLDDLNLQLLFLVSELPVKVVVHIQPLAFTSNIGKEVIFHAYDVAKMRDR
jgi:hypothetical protein